LTVRQVFKLIGRVGNVDGIAPIISSCAEPLPNCPDHDVHDLRSTGWLFRGGAVRDRLDNGRKAAIQVLAFFGRRSFDESPVSGETVKIKVNGRASFPVGRPDFKSGKGR